MPRGDERRSRARVNAEAVGKSARKSRGGNVLQLPDSVKVWYPESADTFAVRVLPYQVTSEHHPDPVKKGQFWYRRPYGIHFDVGGTGTNIACPRYFGGKCPVCDAAKVLADQDYKKHEQEIRTLRPKQFMAYAILDAKGDHDTVLVFDWSKSKFSDKLDDEVKRAGPEVLGFSNADDGMVIKFRTAEETFKGKTYFETDRIDFVDAKALTSVSDEILEAVPKLDDCFDVLSYEAIDALLHGADEAADEDEEEEKPKAKAKAKDEEDEEDDIPFTTPAKAKAKPANDEDEDEEEKPKAKAKVKDEDDWGSEDEDEEEKKSSKKASAKLSSGSEEESEDEDEEEEKPKAKAKAKPANDEDEEDEEPKAKAKAKAKNADADDDDW